MALLSLPAEVLREPEKKDGMVSLETGSPVFRWPASTGASLEKSEGARHPHARRTVEKDRYTCIHTLVLPLVALRHCTTFLASLKWGKWYLPCKDINIIVVVQLLSCVLLFATPWTAARQISLSFTISLSLLKLMSIELVMSSNHLILYHPLLLLPSIFSSIRVFSSESALHIRWPEYWSFRFTISSSNEYSGLISFRIYWFDLLPV